jgi:hypothetical protein
MTLGKLTLDYSGQKTPIQTNKLFTFTDSPAETLSTSTAPSTNSPILNPEFESGEWFGVSRHAPQKVEIQSQTLHLSIPQVSQGPSLGVSRQEMSVGKMIEALNFEWENDGMLCFADQKTERPNTNVQSLFQDRSVLGKRPFNPEIQSDETLEPAMKRHELCLFNRKSGISTGIEDKETLETIFLSNSAGVGGFDLNVGMDVMEF